jgi:hypothetical protein
MNALKTDFGLTESDDEIDYDDFSVYEEAFTRARSWGYVSHNSW